MAKIKDVIKELEILAPPALQENYDNSGLITGDKDREVSGIIVSLDTTESVVDEAIEKGFNLIVSHHPILFTGLKSLTGKNYIERVIIKAIKHDIAIYAIHTNYMQ
jgi:putative NIF3 family GTP cyclohydrolase 1 type 2